MKQDKTAKAEEIPRAIARGNNLSVSFKHSVQIGKVLRGRDVAYCVRYLVDVINQNRPIPTKRYGRDVPHKPGMGAGRYPRKATVEILKIINSAIANAASNHLDSEKLYISRFECGRAVSKNRTSRRNIGRLTNIMIELREREEKKTDKKPAKEKPKPVKEEKPKEKEQKKEKKPKPKAKKPEKKGKSPKKSEKK